MNQWIKVFFFILMIGCWSRASADSGLVSQTTPSPSAATVSPTATPAPSEKDLRLTGRFGIGSGFIDGDGSSYNGLSLRYWLSEKVCVDLIGYYGGYSYTGTDFNGNPVQEPYYYAGGGLAFKYNVAQLRKNFFLQLMGEGSYFHYHYQSSYTDEQFFEDNETLGLFGGLCLEYFLPFFDCLSIESTIGYQQGFDGSTTKSVYNPSETSLSNSTTTGLGTDGRLLVNGGTLDSLYLHFYL